MNNIEDKITKLLALAGSNNPNEANAALLKAQELMLKHNISMEYLGHEEKIVTERINVNPNKHYVRMALLIASNFRTKAWYGRNHVSFIGYLDDVMASRCCLEFLIKESTGCFSRYIYEHNDDRSTCKYRGMPRTMYRHWMDGFICGLVVSFEKRKEEPGYELMLVTPSEVVREFEKLELYSAHLGVIKPNHNEAFEAGYEDGKDALNRRSIPEKRVVSA